MKNLLSIAQQLPGRLAVIAAMSIMTLGVATPAAFAATHTPDTQKCGATDVKCVIAFGDQRISERLEALTKLSGKVHDRHTDKQPITDSEADALQKDVDTNKDGLSKLKTKLDAETDATAARTDIKNIYEQFRIFAVVLPRDYRRLHLDVERTFKGRLNDLLPKLEQRIDKATADQKAKVNPLLANFKAQLADAESQIDNAQTVWPTLTVSSFNTARSSFEAQLKSLGQAETTVHTDLHKASEDLHDINMALKGDHKDKAAPKATATTTSGS